jgi:hypothetical protein
MNNMHLLIGPILSPFFWLAVLSVCLWLVRKHVPHLEKPLWSPVWPRVAGQRWRNYARDAAPWIVWVALICGAALLVTYLRQ